jgi:hypothetical protein
VYCYLAPLNLEATNRTDIVVGLLSRWCVTGIIDVLGADKEASKVRKIRAALSEHVGTDESWFVGDTTGDILEGCEGRSK